jgi:hypothetical protein
MYLVTMGVNIEVGQDLPQGIDSADNLPIAIIPLTPQLRVLDKVEPDINPQTEEPEGRILTAISHRFNLRPDQEAVENDPEIFNGRHDKTHYVYRRGLWGNTGRLHPNIHGNKQREVYAVPTRWIGRHWGALTSFATHHGAWVLASFSEATEHPPESIPLPRGRDKSPVVRRILPPSHNRAA